MGVCKIGVYKVWVCKIGVCKMCFCKIGVSKVCVCKIGVCKSVGVLASHYGGAGSVSGACRYSPDFLLLFIATEYWVEKFWRTFFGKEFEWRNFGKETKVEKFWR